MELDASVYDDNPLHLNIYIGKGLVNIRSKETCYVCLDENSEWMSNILPCGHSIHTRCYAAYIKTKTKFSCPVCGEFDENDPNTLFCTLCKERGHATESECPYMKGFNGSMESILYLDSISDPVDKGYLVIKRDLDKRGIPCKDKNCNGYLVFKEGEDGRFYGCSNYKKNNCKNTAKFNTL